VHVANSAGLVAGADLADAMPPEVNAVRPGLLLYGVQPSATRAGLARLRPVMSLRTRVANVRHVRRGDPVGYGATFRAKQRGRIATIPVGYADGIPWSLGNRGQALLRGRKVPIAGRVSMDLVTLDVGELPVEIGDPVLLFGESAEPPRERLPVEAQAEAAGTIPYELLVRIGRRVARVLEAEA
jgi:alanine racemase